MVIPCAESFRGAGQLAVLHNLSGYMPDGTESVGPLIPGANSPNHQ